ncbi:cation-translocating P-type ATPase [Candidatus Daviesbacteria bacterium]|nr:cation-translocating P-type ATPase [Candidatus Daviesbacteria bacterium]
MTGLTSAEAKQALEKFGPNLLPQKGGISILNIFINQIKNPFTIVLTTAIVLSFIVGDKIDGILIGAILVLNTFLGFWQEYKASKELEALRSLEVLTSRIIRDGREVEISASEIVPQDVVILEAGDKVPADGKLLESYSLQVNESILTGESLPVIKSRTHPSFGGKNDEDQLFFGTTVISGRGKFLCLQTGLNTRFGKIAQTLAEVKSEQTPLEISLSKLIKGVSLVVIIVTILVFLVRFFQGFELAEVLLSSIALMVAAVPEGLPAVVTIVLALGVRKMYQRKALVRKMIAVESLGAATVILSDKTGTLTKNEMRVQVTKVNKGSEGDLLKCAVLCNSANLVLKEDPLRPRLASTQVRSEASGFDILGDTTEGALLLWAKDKGEEIEALRSEGKLLEEIPFSLQTRKMTVIWEHSGKKAAYTKGAPEVILKEVKLPEKEFLVWEKEYQKMASKGLRVLGFSKDEKFLGLIGIADQIREEAKEAIRLAKGAGIKVCMVTGDNELTAKAVSEQLGLLEEGDEVLTGAQLNLLSDEQLKERIDKIKVYARIEPLDKLRIVKIYQSMGEVVAVTGDGVNDALALKQAQIGVSMGKIGSDVSKEASDIILLDDNFATLVSAVEQGRVIYANILKVIKFLLTGNLSEILLISVASFLALPTPLLPTQILWINFVSDGLPALSLGFDNPSSHIMRNSPRKGNNILGVSMVRYVLLGGISIGAICLLTFYYIYQNFGVELARTITFTLLVLLQMILPFIIRRHHSITSNKVLLLSVILVLIMQALILTVPQLRSIFKI